MLYNFLPFKLPLFLISHRLQHIEFLSGTLHHGVMCFFHHDLFFLIPVFSFKSCKMQCIILFCTGKIEYSKAEVFHIHNRTPGTDVKKVKKKKKRKTRLPKNYNPNVPPDPERWLPKWQRKGYRKKKDRRIKDVMKGTQGVSSDAADK